MGLMRESFIFYRSFYESIKDLPADLQIEVIRAISEYSLYGNKVEMSPICKALFTAFCPNIEAAKNRYDACVANGKLGAEHGKKGGRPKKITPNNGDIYPQSTPNETAEKTPVKTPNETGDKPLTDTVTVNDTYTDTVTDTSENNARKVSDSKAFFNGVKDLCSRHLETIYERHQKKPTGDLELGRILSEVERRYMLAEIEDIFKHAAQTYIVKPKMQNLDLIWVCNNLESVKGLPVETLSSGTSPPPRVDYRNRDAALKRQLEKNYDD